MATVLSRGRPQVLQGRFQGRLSWFATPNRVGQPAGAQPSRLGSAFQIPSTINLAHAGQGKPLPDTVRRGMESFFGADFSDVRIHVGLQAYSIGALAFTMGSEIHFAPGQYDPHTPHGQRLLGHELTHVLQQRSGRVKNPFGSGVAVVQDPIMEAEADRMGLRAAERQVQAKTASPAPAIAPRGPVAVQPYGATRFIVHDHESPGVHQVKKTDFLRTLRSAVVQNADNALSNVGQTAKDCPYIPHWFDYYGNKSPQHIEKALSRYAPGSLKACSWRDCIGVVSMKVDEAFRLHVKSGSLAGVPSDLPYLESPRRLDRSTAQARLRQAVAQRCCWCSGQQTTYSQLQVVNNLSPWGGAVSLGYHSTKHWDEIKSSGEFRAGGGKLGPGIYVAEDPQLPRMYGNIGGGATLLEVGYVGGNQSLWAIHEVGSLDEYNETIEGQYDVLVYKNKILGQICYKLNGPNNLATANFRVRPAD